MKETWSCHFLVRITIIIIVFTKLQSELAFSKKSANAQYQKLYYQLFEVIKNDTTDNDFVNEENAEQIDYITITSKGCSSDSIFSYLKPDCQKSMKAVTDYLLAEADTKILLEKAKRLRHLKDLNPVAWYYALTMVTLKRPDLYGLRKPSPVEVNPDAFINSKVIEQSEFLRAGQCILLDEKSGEDNLIENRLWYYREDIQMNSQHLFWHMMNPPNVKQDRHGELFFYYHHILVARYNADRLSNGLQRTVTLKLTNGYIIEEGYNPHLNDAISKRSWDSRPPFTRMPDSTLGGYLTLNWTIITKDRIFKSIDEGTFVTANGQTVPISPVDGYTKLGDITEGNSFTINSNYYGVVHSNGHLLVAYIADTVSRSPKTCGVMSDTSVSMRDPTFYRWHAFVDEISDRYKRNLPAYLLTTGDFPLLWNGVKITKFEVLSSSGVANGPLRTFWSIRTLKLIRRLDFSTAPRPILEICAKHLNYEPFSYNIRINVEGNSTTDKMATLRIYMAPRYDVDGRRFTLDEQRLLFFMMDVFKTALKPGMNVILRNSSQSTITIPWQQHETNWDDTVIGPRPICGCGWPDHLLLPKGTPNGMFFDIFIMATDGIEDNVGEDTQAQTDYQNSCHSVPQLCGAMGKKYPDKKPMGYPFDRVKLYNIRENFGVWSNMRPLKDLDEYVLFLSNTATTQATIVHEDKIRN